MATSQYSSFEDFRGKSGIKLPHGEDTSTRRYGTYIESFKMESKASEAYDTRIKTESDGVWEYMTPMGSGTERPASQRSHSSGIPTSCIPNFVKNRRDTTTSPAGRVSDVHSHATTPSPPPPYTPTQPSSEFRTGSTSAVHGKPFNLLGLPKKDVETELTRAVSWLTLIRKG